MSFHMPRSPYTFEAVDGFFVYTDPKIDLDALPAIAPRFGLLEGMTWEKLTTRLRDLNKQAAQTGEEYKIVYAARHGEGVHNVAEAKYGTKAWDDHWALVNTDGELTWAPDPELTEVGRGQARDANAQWKAMLASDAAAERPPLPTAFFSSPLARSATTLQLTFQDIIWPPAQHSQAVSPLILEGIRENFADRHTCDARSKRSVVAKRWESQGWRVDADMPEEDELFASNVCESPEAMADRVRDALALIWSKAKGDLAINITSHSGTMQALFRAVKTVDFKPKTGGMVTLVIKAKRK